MLANIIKAVIGKVRTPSAVAAPNTLNLEDEVLIKGTPEHEPVYLTTPGLSSSWIRHAYPLKQLEIEIRAFGETANQDAIHSLQAIHHELANGQNSGAVSLPRLQFNFEYLDQVPYLSYFEAPADVKSPPQTEIEALSDSLLLTVKLQGIRPTGRSQVVRLLTPVIAELKAGAHSGQRHDDDYGYTYEVSCMRDQH